MAINDMFTGILNEERNMFTDALLELLEFKEEEKVNGLCVFMSRPEFSGEIEWCGISVEAALRMLL